MIYFKCLRGVVVITTTQLHSTKPELRLCTDSNPARGVTEIRDGENLWQWSRLNAFRRSTIPQKQCTIIFQLWPLFLLTLNNPTSTLYLGIFIWFIFSYKIADTPRKQFANLLFFLG